MRRGSISPTRCTELEEASPIETASKFTDLLTAALSEVDWHEVAGAFLEELEPEPSDDDQEEEETEQEASDQADGPKGPLFSLRQVVSTPRALAALGIEDIETALRRHVTGDWGEVSEADRKENDLSLREVFRVLSAYRGMSGPCPLPNAPPSRRHAVPKNTNAEETAEPVLSTSMSMDR